jgi:hypothetical protein
LGQGQCCSARVVETKSVKHGPLVCCQPRAIREPKSNPITTTSQNVQFAIRQHTPGGIDHALRHGSRLESLSQVSTPCLLPNATTRPSSELLRIHRYLHRTSRHDPRHQIESEEDCIPWHTSWNGRTSPPTLDSPMTAGPGSMPHSKHRSHGRTSMITLHEPCHEHQAGITAASDLHARFDGLVYSRIEDEAKKRKDNVVAVR